MRGWAAADALALHLRGLWGCRDGRPFVVFTGGEPLLQLDAALVVACRERGFGVAVETNGTLPLPCALDWVWVSPKAGAPLALDRADEVKLVFPQDGLAPEELEHIAALHRWLLPMDGARPSLFAARRPEPGASVSGVGGRSDARRLAAPARLAGPPRPCRATAG